jgi:hypothetical protein
MSLEVPLLLLPPNHCNSERLTLRIEAASVLDDLGIELVNNIVSLLAKATSHGAFPVPSLAPTSTYLTIKKVRIQDFRIILFEVHGKGYDLREFELLRNMLERLLLHGIRILSVILSSSNVLCEEKLKAEPTDETEYDAYPAISTLVHIQTIREPLNDGKSRRALVDFVNSVHKTEVHRLDEWLCPWFQLLEAGAFALPVGLPSETDCIAGAVTLFDEQSIEVSINRFQASECAWNAFINMVDACWADARLVSQLTIE